MSRSSTILSFFVAFSLVLTSVAAAQQAPSVEQQLMAGKLADADKMLGERLQHNANDEQAAFELGVVQFLRAVEGLSQNLYRYGARPELGRGQIPFLGAANPTGTNPNPEKLSYEASRAMVQKWLDDLARAEATLAKVQGNSVKLPLHVGMIRLDFNGDGQASDQETLWRLYQGISDLNHAEGEIDVGCAGQKAPAPEQKTAAIEKKAKEFLICFDAGDAHWLRGYCHFLMALGEMVLAHDEQELFERTAHLFFPNVETPHAWLNQQNRAKAEDGAIPVEALDGIAFIHLIRLPLKEPKRMQAALGHLQTVLRESRESWKLILAETDDDHEWLPNPKQTAVLPETKVTADMVRSWQSFLDEADQILDGKKLVPFWRSAPGLGLNLHQIFTEPRPFDLVLWIQGTAATPYLQKGPMTTPEVWQQMLTAFGDELPGYAIWFN